MTTDKEIIELNDNVLNPRAQALGREIVKAEVLAAAAELRDIAGELNFYDDVVNLQGYSALVQRAHGVADELSEAFSRGDRGQELLREECERYGLPVRLDLLLRHISNNHAATLGVKDNIIRTLTAQRDEAREQLIEVTDALEPIPWDRAMRVLHGANRHVRDWRGEGADDDSTE